MAIGSGGRRTGERGRWRSDISKSIETLIQHSVSGWVMVGYCQWSAGRFTEALVQFEKALEIDPTQADALYYMAENARREGELQTALQYLARIRDVPESLEISYNHLAGVLLVLTGQSSEQAARHLEHVVVMDNAAKVLLSLAYLRSGEQERARPLLADLCTSASDTVGPESWLRCLDQDYCGELAGQRLEILRLLLANKHNRVADGLLADALRVHLRHEVCSSDEIDFLLGPLVERHPESCRLLVLRSLLLMCGEATVQDQCDALAAVEACFRNGDESSWLPFTGPILDPLTGAWLDAERLEQFATLRRSEICNSPRD